MVPNERVGDYYCQLEQVHVGDYYRQLEQVHVAHDDYYHCLTSYVMIALALSGRSSMTLW